MNFALQFPHLATYVRFLKRAAAAAAMPGWRTLETNERALFEEIFLAWADEHPLSVRQAIELKGLGSPATLHKRLARLRKMDMVYAKADAHDRRIKWLEPTHKGLQYANTLGMVISAGA